MAMVRPRTVGQSARQMAHPSPMAARQPSRTEIKRLRLNHDAPGFRKKFRTHVFLCRACLSLPGIAATFGAKLRRQNRASEGSAFVVASSEGLASATARPNDNGRSEEHTSELQSPEHHVCRL